jgi:hypothetical protein
MFPSKKRAINIPQFEHARLAATLALCWGNADFPAPAVDRSSLVRGVLMHDRGYGMTDNAPLLALPEEEWQAILRRGLELVDSDPVADHIARLHIHRLLFHSEDPAVAEEARVHYRQLVEDAGQDWAGIDAITNLCDRLSFEACFEVASSKKVELSLGTFIYGLDANGDLFCSPWPFSQDQVSGIILGYERDGSAPVVVPFSARPR